MFIISQTSNGITRYITKVVGGGYKLHKWKYTDNINHADKFASTEDAKQFMEMYDLNDGYNIMEAI